MHPLVRDLYKRFLMAGRDYPGGVEVVRRKAREGILQNAHLADEVEIKRAVKWGRAAVRDLHGVTQLKKYRTLKDRY